MAPVTRGAECHRLSWLMPEWVAPVRISDDEGPDDFVDLVYLDPPLKSNATYNVLFKEKSRKKSGVQIGAFEDP